MPTAGSYQYSQLGYHHLETWDISGEDYGKIQYWRQNNIDTTHLDSCIRKILDKILNSNTSIGKLLVKMEKSIFKNSNIEKFKIKFAVKNMGGDTLGLTTPGNMQNKIWYDTIYIDQGVADSASEIGVTQVIIHEVVHAYLKSIINRYAASSFNSAQIAALKIDTLFSTFIDSMVAINTRKNLIQWLNADPQKQHNFMADRMLNAFSEILKSVDDGRNSNEFYWLMGWLGLKSTRTIKFYWPNYSQDSPLDWPPTNPSPSEDSTMGLKYALTETRLDSMRKYNTREIYNKSKAKGRPKQPTGCY
jgi:hypothetical protein